MRDFHYRWEWQLRSTPEQLWPYVSDTQRFNRVAVGYTVQAIPEDDEVAHLRPYALADQWKASRCDVLRLCLAATRRSLLGLRWDVVCPMCRGAKASVPQLSEVQDQAHCPSCRMNFDVDFDHALKVTFRPNAAVRSVEIAEYCVGGPQLTPHLVAQQNIAPGETRTISVALDSGDTR